ncbi:hypothetical protein KSP40_PGU001560 [Platanthera guangdongensis]|uniref:Uncharacterized protein n=1 Tax=Platanthera guangdongensis TaxID=2320717 RepID=A0ABR2M254_9ASPA
MAPGPTGKFIIEVEFLDLKIAPTSCEVAKKYGNGICRSKCQDVGCGQSSSGVLGKPSQKRKFVQRTLKMEASGCYGATTARDAGEGGKSGGDGVEFFGRPWHGEF